MVVKKKTSKNDPVTSLKTSPGTSEDEPAILSPKEHSKPPQQRDQGRFPIVGIGASAGGLAAIEALVHEIPADSGIAFILVQHLSPDHESLLVEIIKRSTRLEVFQIQDGQSIQPNCIYVIPPNRDLALIRGNLHLIEPSEQRGFRLPIDFLFRSLAEDQGEKAICIILSGTGSDGTQGLKAIHSAGGMVMAQEPQTAQYNNMPNSAIETGLVDYILPPEAIPEQIIQHIKGHSTPRNKPVASPLDGEKSAVEKILIILRSHTKHDFSLYKRNTLNRRIERRLVVNRIENVADYLRYLRQTPLEVEMLFGELLIGVTCFFRDKEVFEAIEQRVIPQLIQNRQPDQSLRVWVTGCSTGEEAYSIAILLREQMDAQKQEFEVQIFATDLDKRAIEQARQGVYPENIRVDVSEQRLQQYFTQENNTYQVKKEIREMIVFADQSITRDPPFSKMDLITCRNLLIYLETELQKKVIPLFHYALKRNGFLLLGTSETLGEFDHYFYTVDRKVKLFQRITDETIPQSILNFTMPSSTHPEIAALLPTQNNPLKVRELTEKILLQDHTPPCVIINNESDILFFHGRTSDYLELTSGEASLDILRMARDDLRIPISISIQKAIAQKTEVIYENIDLQVGGERRIINLIVKPIDQPSSLQPLFMVVFQESASLNAGEQVNVGVEATPERDQRLLEMQRDLQSTKEYLRTIIEELETANEELKSSNEELQSTNEELQSTNEELETAKEELQSVNEELITVNSELQSKIQNLSQANNDLNNLLSSVEVGIVFLDTQLQIQRFNVVATKLINLIQMDVGRPIGHIVSNLIDDDLARVTLEVMDTLIPYEADVQSQNGKWYRMQIRPYRTVENVIEGLVITYAEITQQKQAIKIIEAARLYTANIVATIREPLLVLDEQLQIISANRSFYQVFQVKSGETVGRLIYEIGNGQWNIPQLRELLETILPEQTSFEDFEVDVTFPDIGRRKMMINARQMYSALENTQLILLSIEIVTENK